MNYDILSGLNIATAPFIAAAVVLAVLFLVALGAIIQRRRERNPALHDRFESDHDGRFLGLGSTYLFGATLANRVGRDQDVKIRELSVSEREWVVSEWQAIQSKFVDHPRTALIEADDLINALLETRGYHEASSEQRETGDSADQPVKENYGVAHSIAVRFGPVEPTAQELGTAMIQYCNIFDHLLKTPKRPETELLHKSRLEAKGSLTRAQAM